MSTTIATGTKPTMAVCVDGRVFVYWIHAGNSVKGIIYDASGATLKSAFTAVATADDAGIGAECSVTSTGQLRVVLLCVVAGSVTQYISTDGYTFV